MIAGTRRLRWVRVGAGVGTVSRPSRLRSPGRRDGRFPYAAAKSGLVGLTRSLALEVGPKGIRVNALSPGYVETALVAEFFARSDPELREKVLAHPLGRMARPADVAGCAVFHLSDEAAFVTGANCRVDGGLSARFAG